MLPRFGQEVSEIVLIGQRGESAEHIGEIRVRVDAVALAGADQGVEHGGAVAGFGVPDEEPIFLSHRRRPDGVFNDVGVEFGLAVVLVRRQRGPVAEQIRARFAEAGLRQHGTGEQFLRECF